MIDIGVASPKAHGQAMMSTAIAFKSAWPKRGSGPTSIQMTKVATATSTTPGTNHPETRSRSEEHTSELQSLMRISYAVFCLKKKKTRNNTKLATIKR